MPGTSSDQPRHPAAKEAVDPTAGAVPRRIRVTNLYVTPWLMADGSGSGDLPDYLRLWRFEPNYRLSADQLPSVVHRETIDTSTLTFKRWAHVDRLTGARAWLFSLPSGQIVAGLSLDVCCELGGTIDLLEDCYFADVRTDDEPVETYLRSLIARFGGDCDPGEGFLPERHQVVFDRDPAPDDCEDLVQRLVYRADLPYRKEHSAIRYPAELNRRPGWLAAVGPYVSVVCGHSDFIENAIFTSAILGVAAAAQLRAIRQAAYMDVRLFRSLEAQASTRERRQTLERIADQLGDLELELSYSVEATADFGLLVPSLRVESFHNALYDCIGLADKAATAGRMLQRLSAAISAELTAIESIERRADDNRRVRYAVAVGFVSAVAIPASLILTFLGINASQVRPHRSMFSHAYLGMYAAVGALVLIGAAMSAGLWVRHRREARHHRASRSRPRWAAPHSTNGTQHRSFTGDL